MTDAQSFVLPVDKPEGPTSHDVVARARRALGVRRIYDERNNTLVYVSYSRQIKEGSAKMAVSTVPLFDEQVSWAEGRPD